jgi:hypothetical protein
VFRFPPEVIAVAVRWYLRYGLSLRDVEELLAERGIEVDHVTVYRWLQRFTPLFADAARPLRHATGDRWFVDETYVKVAGQWRYLYRAVDVGTGIAMRPSAIALVLGIAGYQPRNRSASTGQKQFRSAARIAAGHAFVQNLRRGHYQVAIEVPSQLRLTTAFTELAQAM